MAYTPEDRIAQLRRPAVRKVPAPARASTLSTRPTSRSFAWQFRRPSYRPPALVRPVAPSRLTPSPTSIAWFVPGGTISQLPHAGHVALDVGAGVGTPVYNPVAGIVTAIQRLTSRPSFGYNVRIRTPNGLEQVFAHLAEIDVAQGQTIAAGEIVGAVGATGTRDSHLHYEVRAPGADVFNRQWSTSTARDPVSFLQSFGRAVSSLVGRPIGNRPPAAGSAALPIASARATAIPSTPSREILLSRTLEARPTTAGQVTPGSAGAARAAQPAAGSGLAAVRGAGDVTPAPEEGRILLETPIGAVRLPAIHWWNVAGFILGSVLVVIGIAQLAKGGIESGARGIERLERLKGQATKIATTVAAIA